MKAYYILRKDLNMSPAKLAIQVGHGTDLIHQNCNEFVIKQWVEDSRKKIVLKIKDLQKLEELDKKLLSDAFLIDELDWFSIYDNGLTEFNGKTLTGIVIYPIEDNKIPHYIKRLRLYD